jgi:hypothetical protein
LKSYFEGHLPLIISHGGKSKYSDLGWRSY